MRLFLVIKQQVMLGCEVQVHVLNLGYVLVIDLCCNSVQALVVRDKESHNFHSKTD